MPPPPIPYPTPNSKSETRPRKGGKPKNVKPQTKSQLKPRKRKRNDDYGEEAQDSGSGENESDGDGDDPTEPVGTRRSVRTQGSRHVAPGPYREFDESDDEDRLEDQQPGKGLAAAVNCTEECDTEMNAEQSTKERHEINVQNAIRVKAEPDEGNTLSVLSGTIPMTAGDNADQDTQMDETGNDYDHAMLIAADDEEEEEKPKPDLSLRYAGYTIPDVCLTIIVEPWSSPSRAGTREPSIVPTGPGAGINRSRFVGVVASTPAREETEPPLESTSTPASRAQTPLFREFTPMPEAGPSVSAPLRPPAPQTFGRILPRVPLFHEATPAPEDDFLPDNFDDGDEENETSSIMQFSQAMNLGSTKSSGFGNGNEGDEDDMDVFLADADEGR
ncbi:hypothetical protein FRB95_000040 [Tulasnella sp. JGI-2019a]|nr:hypothetical protein FRB95_000040 [Tulasnella sp. JGI-2019a]